MLIIVIASLAGGCASQKASHASQASLEKQHEARYVAQSASALVFEPRLAQAAHPDLSRSDRGPSAFQGFEQSVTIFSYQQNNDRQSDVFGDQIDRRNFSATTSVTIR